MLANLLEFSQQHYHSYTMGRESVAHLAEKCCVFHSYLAKLKHK